MVTTEFLNRDLSGNKWSLSSLPSHRIQSLANDKGFPVEDPARTVIVNADETFYLCVVPASCHIDMEILSWLLGADKIHFATEEEIAQLFPDGRLDTASILAKIVGLPSVMDKRILTTNNIIFQVLPHSKTVRINLADFERMATPQVLDFCY